MLDHIRSFINFLNFEDPICKFYFVHIAIIVFVVVHINTFRFFLSQLLFLLRLLELLFLNLPLNILLNEIRLWLLFWSYLRKIPNHLRLISIRIDRSMP